MQKRKLDVIGAKTVHVRKSTSNTKHATVAVAIAGDCTVLLSMVVCKGKSDGQNAKTEFATYPTTNH